nr:coiled-coil domain-containing protein 30-like [Pogona vitticeps]
MDSTKPLEGALLQGEKSTAEAEEGELLDEAAGDENVQPLHKRCRQLVESMELENAQLRRQLQKLEREHEDVVERNEELESLLGEAQNRSQEEREQLQDRVDGLRRKVARLEAELCQAQKMKPDKVDEDTADFQKRLKIHQEKVRALESKLSEVEKQREQLAGDLEVTQKALNEEKKEVNNSRSELLRLYGEIQVLRGAAEERDFLHVTHEKLRQEKLLLETQVSDLSQKCERLNQLVTEGKKPGERFWARTRDGVSEEPFAGPGEEMEQLRLQLLESSRRVEEVEKQLQGSREEKSLLWEENSRLRSDILALRHQLSARSPGTVRSRHEAGFGENPPPVAHAPAGSADGNIHQVPPGEKLLRQQEELQRLRHDVHRVQNLCRSTEKELRHEREKNLELRKHNVSLQQENIKVKAELRQVQLKLSEASQACSSLTSQAELSHQKAQELELQLMKQAQAAQQQSGLREKLAQEKARVAEAEKTIAELQQKLKDSQHQMHLLGKKQLEEEVKEAREKQARAQRQFQEEQQKRKFLEQRAEELHQQLRSAREKETQLTRTCAEGQVQSQQLEARLRILEEEKRTLSNEHLHCQKYSQKLSEQLLALQQEKDTLHEEYMHILEQVDLSIRFGPEPFLKAFCHLRKNRERKLRHRAKLRRAKETFISEVKQRDVRLRHLEDEVQLSKSLREKDQALIRRMAAENESLLQKKAKLSQQLLDLEEADRSSKRVLSTTQSRLHYLNEENKRLQDRILQLTSQVGALERALRNIHSHNLEELKSIGFSECHLQSQMPALPNLSLSVGGLADTRGFLKAIKDGKGEAPAEKPSLSPSPEIGYLNVASPGDPADVRREEPTQPSCYDGAEGAREDF